MQSIEFNPNLYIVRTGRRDLQQLLEGAMSTMAAIISFSFQLGLSNSPVLSSMTTGMGPLPCLMPSLGNSWLLSEMKTW